VLLDQFDVKNKIYQLFTADTELMGLLMSPATDEEKNDRVRKLELDVKEITADIIPFVTVVFLPANNPTSSYAQKHGLLEISIYCSAPYEANFIFKRIKKIIQSNFEDMAIGYEGASSSGVLGIYKYILRCKPIVRT
jgi:hypothetical protein